MNKTNSEIIAEAVEEYYKKLLPNENAKGLADIKRFHLSNMMGDTISIMNIIIDKARTSGLPSKSNKELIDAMGQYYEGGKTWLLLTDVITALDNVRNSALAEIEKMKQQANLAWYLNAVEKELSKHNTPASNIMNIISHVQYEVGELEKQLSDANAKIKKYEEGIGKLKDRNSRSHLCDFEIDEIFQSCAKQPKGLHGVVQKVNMMSSILVGANTVLDASDKMRKDIREPKTEPKKSFDIDECVGRGILEGIEAGLKKQPKE